MNYQEHLLTCLMEELAGVQQEISKCLRFGCDHKGPGLEHTNLEKVQLEFADVGAIRSLLSSECELDTVGRHANNGAPVTAVTQRYIDKIRRTRELAGLAKELGTIE